MIHTHDPGCLLACRGIGTGCATQQEPGACGAADTGQCDDPAHGPGRSVRERTDECGANNPGAILDRADQRGNSASAVRKAAERADDRIGHDETRHGDEHEQRYDQTHEAATISPGRNCQRDSRQRCTDRPGPQKPIAAEALHQTRIGKIGRHDADNN